jgi:hypothetical protein
MQIELIKNWSKFLLIFVVPAFFLISCDLLTNDDEKDTKTDELYVKFNNDQGSLYRITNIQLMDMGKAGEESTPSGTWSENILESGKSIAPGSHEFFTLNIENLHWCQYRLGVDPGNGTEVMLHLQDGYTLPDVGELPITHWGSDERTVGVSVTFDETSNLIYVNGWSDFAGIE